MTRALSISLLHLCADTKLSVAKGNINGHVIPSSFHFHMDAIVRVVIMCTAHQGLGRLAFVKTEMLNFTLCE